MHENEKVNKSKKRKEVQMKKISKEAFRDDNLERKRTKKSSH